MGIWHFRYSRLENPLGRSDALDLVRRSLEHSTCLPSPARCEGDLSRGRGARADQQQTVMGPSWFSLTRLSLSCPASSAGLFCFTPTDLSGQQKSPHVSSPRSAGVVAGSLVRATPGCQRSSLMQLSSLAPKSHRLCPRFLALVRKLHPKLQGIHRCVKC